MMDIPIATYRTAMKPLHREVFDTNHTHLIASLRASDVIDSLLGERVISRYDYDQLRRTEPQGGRAMNRLLVLTLRRRGGDAYPALVRALRESGQDHLCDVMQGQETGIRHGMNTARVERNNHHHNVLAARTDHNDLESDPRASPVLEPQSLFRRPLRSPISAGTRAKLHPETEETNLPSTFLPSSPRRGFASSPSPAVWARETSEYDPNRDASPRGVRSPPAYSPLTRKAAYELQPQPRTPSPGPKSPPSPSPPPALTPARAKPDSHPQPSPRYGKTATPAFASNPLPGQVSDRDPDVDAQRYKEQMQQMQESHSAREEKLQQQIQKLEKDQEKGAQEKKKEKGCVVM